MLAAVRGMNEKMNRSSAVGRQRDGYWKDPRQSRAGYYYFYLFFLPFREIWKSPHPWLLLFLLLDGNGCCLFWFFKIFFNLCPICCAFCPFSSPTDFLTCQLNGNDDDIVSRKKKSRMPLSLRIVSWHIYSLVTAAGKWENAVPI